MNGYSIMADSYRKLADEGKLGRKEAEKEARIYDFLSSCDEDDLYSLIDSSAFNDIIRGYVKIAVNNTDIDEESKKKVMNESRWMFDGKNAKSALKEYLN